MVRDALSADAKSIAKVHVASWQEAYIDLMPADFLDSLVKTLQQRATYWASAIESQEAEVLVADIEGSVVGWISIGPCRDEDRAAEEFGEVMAIYLLPEYWGKGIGTELWKSGLKRLSDQGCRFITLWVLSKNERAIRFYQRLGAVEDSNSHRTLVRGGIVLDEVRYILSIKA